MGNTPKQAPVVVPSGKGDKPKPKRKMLTAEQRVAKLEKELAAAKAKADEKDHKMIAKLTEQRVKLVNQIDERNFKVKDIDEQLQLLGVEDPALPTPADLGASDQAKA